MESGKTEVRMMELKQQLWDQICLLQNPIVFCKSLKEWIAIQKQSAIQAHIAKDDETKGEIRAYLRGLSTIEQLIPADIERKR